jgi:hypothetical protein
MSISLWHILVMEEVGGLEQGRRRSRRKALSTDILFTSGLETHN